MRRVCFCPVTLLIVAGFALSLWSLRDGAQSAQLASDEFQIAFAAGQRNDTGRFMGGTEMRVLAAHAGKLFAGNGYWKDRPGPEGLQGAQILVLGTASGRWQVDHAFDELMPARYPRDLAVSALREVGFTTDWHGAHLLAPIALLLAAVWDLTGTTRAFVRDDGSGDWSAATLARDPPNRNFLPQLRSFGTHVDAVTGTSLVFAGQDPRGIFSGGYDASAPGRIRWRETPELRLADVAASGLSGPNAGLRVMSFAECNGHLYAAVGQAIYERVDGAEPQWRQIYQNQRPGHSETGLRGLTAIPNAAGGEALLAAVEGSTARIVRIDPRDGSETTELNLVQFLGRAWGMRTGYVIAAYNDMTKVPDAAGGDALLIGLETFVAPALPVPAGHAVVDVGYGRLDRGGWYLVRHSNGRYDLRQIPREQALVAVRAIQASPFPDVPGAVYFAGYDANKAPAHDTAWIVRATTAAALGAAPR
jgi:hypothetical protein